MTASSRFISILNLFTMLLSIPIASTGFWLVARQNSECMKFLQWPLMVLGLFMLLLSMAGFVGSCWSVKWLLWLYLFVMFMTIALLFAFTVFTLVVTSNAARVGSPTTSFHQYMLSDYSGWLPHRVKHGETWKKISSCLQTAKVCAISQEKPAFWAELYYQQINPLQLGCCKPPAVCGYTNINATLWVNPENMSADTDCEFWSNNEATLCFHCNTCKAGLLANLTRDWHKVAAVNIVTLAFLISIYFIGCLAFQNIKRSSIFYSRWKGDELIPHEDTRGLTVVDQRIS